MKLVSAAAQKQVDYGAVSRRVSSKRDRKQRVENDSRVSNILKGIGMSQGEGSCAIVGMMGHIRQVLTETTR
jgi:hypothetical protein